MPELPDVTVYVERIEAMLCGSALQQIRVGSPFVLRTVSPSPDMFRGRGLSRVERLGKRIVLFFDDDYVAVIHLMIAGRLRWKKPGAALPARNGLAAFEFVDGTLIFTEASKKKRASLHLLDDVARLAEFDRGGIEVLDCDADAFATAMTRENHTLKRALTDPTILSGIGNAYSDEILHDACMSPFKQTKSLSEKEFGQLFDSVRRVLRRWTDRHRERVGDKFPDKVTAFHPEMAVHGKYREPCPRCQAPVQRIVYAENEANYCAKCQTAGKVLADRSLSRLLKENWPRTLEELEVRLPNQQAGKKRPPG